ncbi:hypothetical protein CVT25_014756 [Psilocybe cyanescens]|uniref:NGN domain-containing protein n=1 Tax=Psilocybe cyanescens TaxID=93625 RepID=A0A409X8Z7_PSICY|nr:hypothetical protein CVT25_014756 [Psilocybe cyanescens]
MSVLQFIDAEAQEVDVSEDESEDFEDFDCFIDDDSNEGQGLDIVPKSAVEFNKTRDERMANVIQRIQERMDCVALESQNFGSKWIHAVEQNHKPYIHQSSDYPTWRVDCRKGEEEIAVMSLLHTARDHHQLRSAFTRVSIRGHIYLECTMNQEIIKLLMKTPGVICTRHGIGCKLIQRDESLNILRMLDVKRDVLLEQWVRITKGVYKGDIGRVESTNAWGVSLLLVPHITYRSREDVSLKRKSTCHIPEPRLFDPLQFCNVVRDTVDNQFTYHIADMTFESGLIKKDFDYGYIATDVDDMLLKLFNLFQLSEHPFVIDPPMPKPREWNIDEGDLVVLTSVGWRGTVVETTSRFVDVSVDDDVTYLSDNEAGNNAISGLDGSTGQPKAPPSVVHTTWDDVEKIFEPGDYVHVNSSIHSDLTGWIVKVEQSVATVVDNQRERSYRTSMTDQNMKCEVPFQHVLHETEYVSRLNTRIKHPWCGITVIVMKSHHVLKGAIGVIKDVSPQSQEDDDMQILIELSRYDSNSPFKNVNVNSKDILVHGILKPLKEMRLQDTNAIAKASRVSLPQNAPQTLEEILRYRYPMRSAAAHLHGIHYMS